MSFPRGWRDASLASRVARAEKFRGFPPSEPKQRRAPQSAAQVAFFTAVKAIGGPWDPFAQTEEALEAMKQLQSRQAGKVEIVRDVPYVRQSETREYHKQMCDVHLPSGAREGLPLVIHFHGGGWQDGDRQDEMFGAPAVARSHAAAGCVVVTPSYRLGNRKAIMADAQRVVLWAVTNASTLGADPERLYLSGHSAGGNIAALLALGPWLAPPVLPAGTIKGVIGISGVYTLVRPLGGTLSWYKNHIFDKYLRKEVFGDDVATLAQYSPSALARLGSRKATPFKARWSEALGKLTHESLAAVNILLPRGAGAKAAPSGLEDVSWVEEVPPVLLINASWDLGLEDDAAYFARTLKARTGKKQCVHLIPETNHATVCWDERSFERCREFIAECESLVAQCK